MDYIEEGRLSLVNAILAYGQGFGLLNKEDIDQALIEGIEEFCHESEAIVPVFVSMYEATKTLSGKPDLTFIEWIQELGKSGRFGDMF